MTSCKRVDPAGQFPLLCTTAAPHLFSTGNDDDRPRTPTDVPGGKRRPISHPLGTIHSFTGAFDDRARNAVARVPRRLTPVVVGLATDQRTFALQEGDR